MAVRSLISSEVSRRLAVSMRLRASGEDAAGLCESGAWFFTLEVEVLAISLIVNALDATDELT